ncbi:MAG: DUF2269 domain-containing protein [Rhodobacteraceae bacterium]|nr:DUF2269 domain-containing protein [Paracoccaceae bacterium]
MDYYELAKWVHILSSTVLFGTGMGTAFQMVAAMHRRKPQVVATVARNVVIADWIFTTPAGLIQPISGVTLVYLAGWSLTEPWLIVTYFLYVMAFCAWVPVVWLQGQIRDLSAESVQNGTGLCEKCLRYYRIWFTLGWPAFIALMGIFWLMIAKPQLWG